MTGKRISLSVIVGVMTLLGCLLAALLLTVVLQAVAPSLAGGGRDFRSAAAIAAFLLAVAGFWLTWRRGHSLPSVLASLLVIEGVLALAIGSASGSWSVDRFNLSWFLGLNRYLALPFLAAAVAGLAVRSWRNRSRQAPDSTR